MLLLLVVVVQVVMLAVQLLLQMLKVFAVLLEHRLVVARMLEASSVRQLRQLADGRRRRVVCCVRCMVKHCEGREGREKENG